METNKILATATENNLPEVVQDNFGNTKALGKPVVFTGVTSEEARAAIKKVFDSKNNIEIK